MIEAGSSTKVLEDFLNDEREKISQESESIEKLSKINSPSGFLNNASKKSLADQVWERVKNGPFIQLGKDFIAEQIARNGQQLLANIDAQTSKFTESIKQTVNQVKETVFNTIATAVTLQNDLVLFFLKNLADEIVDQMERKIEIAGLLKEKVTTLYNAVSQLVSADPFFGKYLVQLRIALTLIDGANTDLKRVHNTLVYNNIFLSRRFEDAQRQLEEALKLMEPNSAKPPDKLITDKQSNPLSKIGIPKEPQQLTLILSIPQLVKEALAAANGYFAATIKVNALLLAFIQGYKEFTESTSNMTKNLSTETIKKVSNMLNGVVFDMATRLNGSQSHVSNIMPGFRPDSIQVSSWALDWTLKLHTVIAMLKAVPGTALTKIQASNRFLTAYDNACNLIKQKNNRSSGGAVLTATEGREEFGQLERQLATFTLGSLAAIVDTKTANNILPVGNALIKRIELSEIQDGEIVAILRSFAASDIGVTSELQKTGNQIMSLLKRLGLDRAFDLLKNGNFAEFFNLNSKTATYIGAAIMAISKLKGCLSTTEDQSILDKAQTELERAQKSKDLLARRGISESLTLRQRQLELKEQKIDSLQNQVSQVGGQIQKDSKCSLPADFMPSNLLKNLGPVLGVGAFNSGTIGKQFQNLGKGIL